MDNNDWPPISGDFHVKAPQGCVAVCTLGKKLEVQAEYCIIGTCKTENIGIERIVINVVSNPAIRFFILAGPEVPGHLTGNSLRAMYNSGVDSETRKIVDAPGAIPFIENIPLESVERFRQQVEFVDMINNSRVDEIAAKVEELSRRNPGPFPDEPIWIKLGSTRTRGVRRSLGSSIGLLPEFNAVLDPCTSLVSVQLDKAVIARGPPAVGVEIRVTDTGTTLVGKEL